MKVRVVCEFKPGITSLLTFSFKWWNRLRQFIENITKSDLFYLIGRLTNWNNQLDKSLFYTLGNVSGNDLMYDNIFHFAPFLNFLRLST